jgi:hypothetical protein
MVGVVVSMVLSVTCAAVVLAGQARRNAPDGGWGEFLNSGYQAFRAKELTFPVSDESDDDGATGDLRDLFTMGEPGEEPAYAEGVELRGVIGRALHLTTR